jgi:hypothetical protein
MEECDVHMHYGPNRPGALCGCDDQIGTKKEANAAPNHGSMISRVYVGGGDTHFL